MKVKTPTQTSAKPTIAPMVGEGDVLVGICVGVCALDEVEVGVADAFIGVQAVVDGDIPLAPMVDDDAGVLDSLAGTPGSGMTLCNLHLTFWINYCHGRSYFPLS